MDLDLKGHSLARAERETEDAVDFLALGHAEAFVEEEGRLLPPRRLLRRVGRIPNLERQDQTFTQMETA